MYRFVVLCSVCVFSPLAIAQAPRDVVIESRYGIPGNARLFPQADPKAALTTAIKAIESNRFDYLVAHLLEEGFVEQRLTERAALLVPRVDAELRALRARQRQDVTLDKRLQLPDEPPAFEDAIQAEARLQAFKLVVSDIQEKQNADPTLLKTLKRFLREGDFTVDGDTATVTLRDLKNRQVFFKKVGERWYLENRQQPKPEGEAGKN